MRRILSGLLCLAMLLSILPLAIFAEGDTHVHGRVLEELLLENEEGIDCCGKFYCESCGTYYYDSVTSADLGVPVLNITGDISECTKENTVSVNITYDSETKDFSSAATLKVQGGTSADFPKKNYTVKFLKEDGSKNKIKIVESWGKQSQYCLKANYMDASHSRNIVSARLFNDIVHSRCKNDELDALKNGGVIDGFPVAVYNNGVFHGLYTFNIPKDNWMMGMNDETLRQAMLFGGTWSDSVALRAPIADFSAPDESGWDIEYCSTEDDPEVGCDWALESMNDFIDFLNNSYGDDFKSRINQYTDVDRAIDVMIFTYFIHADDNTSKNMIWATFDGTKWIPSVYDMDATWGLFWTGDLSVSINGFQLGNGNLLFEKLRQYYMPEITQRYYELRSDILSLTNIRTEFKAFFDSVPNILRSADNSKWPNVPSISTNNFNQVYNYIAQRVTNVDDYYGADITEKPRYAYKAEFDKEQGTVVSVFPKCDYTSEPVVSYAAFSVSEIGTLTRRGGRIDFLIETPEGKEVDTVTATNGTVLTPDDTYEDGVYAVTDISANLTVTITLKDSVYEGYDVFFDCGDLADVYVYAGQDYTQTPQICTQTQSINSDTLLPDKSGDGQVNFLVVPRAGYLVESVDVTPSTGYKNLKDPEGLGADNTYRITKIKNNLTVTITLAEDTSIILGDLNRDGKVNAVDANALNKVISGLADFNSAGDINGDEKITVYDLNLFLKMLTGTYN